MAQPTLPGSISSQSKLQLILKRSNQAISCTGIRYALKINSSTVFVNHCPNSDFSRFSQKRTLRKSFRQSANDPTRTLNILKLLCLTLSFANLKTSHYGRSDAQVSKPIGIPAFSMPDRILSRSDESLNGYILVQ